MKAESLRDLGSREGFNEREHIQKRFARSAEKIHAATEATGVQQAEDETPEVRIERLDLSPFVRPDAYLEADREQAVAQLVRGLTELGFLLIEGHGVPQSLMDDVVAAARRFFALPEDVKRQVADEGSSGTQRGWAQLPAGSGGETFMFGPPIGTPRQTANRWPEGGDPGFRRTLETYYTELERVETVLLRMIALGLGCEAEHFMRDNVGGHRGLVSLNYSADLQERDRARMAPHTDWSTVTILFTPQPGLELIQDGQWRRVPAIPGTFVVNTGDMLERWSGGRFKSTIHGVRRWRDRVRVSVPFFGSQSLDPADETLIDVIAADELSGELKFPPVTIKDFIANHWSYFNETFAKSFESDEAKARPYWENDDAAP